MLWRLVIKFGIVAALVLTSVRPGWAQTTSRSGPGQVSPAGPFDRNAMGIEVAGGVLTEAWNSNGSHEVIGEGTTRVAVSDARIAGVTITDAMVLELDDAGLIVRIRPHLRPWLAITLFALLLGPKIARHPGVLRRALRR